MIQGAATFITEAPITASSHSGHSREAIGYLAVSESGNTTLSLGVCVCASPTIKRQVITTKARTNLIGHDEILSPWPDQLVVRMATRSLFHLDWGVWHVRLKQWVEPWHCYTHRIEMLGGPVIEWIQIFQEKWGT